jgi:hypothetical protein
LETLEHGCGAVGDVGFCCGFVGWWGCGIGFCGFAGWVLRVRVFGSFFLAFTPFAFNVDTNLGHLLATSHAHLVFVL